MIILLEDKTVQPPSDPENVFFLLKWSTEIITGLISALTVLLFKMKGQKTDIVPLSENHINNKLEICAGELERKLKDKFAEDLRLHGEDMLRQIELMILANNATTGKRHDD